MQRAGGASAAIALQKFPRDVLSKTVIFTGPGNNGGDGWVMAAALSHAGLSVEVIAAVESRTPDAVAERADAMALPGVEVVSSSTGARLVVDALLGTGSSGPPRGAIAGGVAEIARLKRAGAKVVALDLPTGLDATTGAQDGAVAADLTLTFGSVKRGQLLARDLCGEILAIDIGLGEPGDTDTIPELLDGKWVLARIPGIRYDDNKGDRGKLAIVAGGPGMPGAAILVARAALRSGIGLVRLLVHESSLPAVANAVPSALISSWPDSADRIKALIGDWANALVIGPGLGNNADGRKVVEDVMRNSNVPTLLDADALNVFAGDISGLSRLLGGRKSVITPHSAEFGRLIGKATDLVLRERFDIGVDVARQLGAVTLLKGPPTVISDSNGKRYCSSRGSGALATGGSGDMLSGIAGALLAQTGDPLSSACCAAWVGGRAAELCEYVRGTTLEDVLFALPRAWNEPETPLDSPVLARLDPVRAVS